MNLRYWASFLAFSILLHAALFWPLPGPSLTLGGVSPLIVSFSGVAPTALPPDSHAQEASYSSSELEPEARIEKAGIQSKTPSSKLAGLGTRKQPPQQQPPDELPNLPNLGSKASESRLQDSPVINPSEVAGPSIASYRLALALEVLRKRASVERFVTPDFKGKVVVLISLRGSDVTPQVSLEEAAGSELLDREILSVFRRAVETVPVSIAGDVGEVNIRLPVRFDQAALD